MLSKPLPAGILALLSGGFLLNNVNKIRWFSNNVSLPSLGSLRALGRIKVIPTRRLLGTNVGLQQINEVRESGAELERRDLGR